MSEHRISKNGLSIECHAAPDAKCRHRPDCEPEQWNDAGCEDHDGEHKLTPGHECWLLPWVNSPGSLGETNLHDEHAEIIPGESVRFESDVPDYVCWEYEKEGIQ